MANTLGQLVVSLGLDAADFTSGLTKSELQAQRFADQMDRTVAAGIIKAELALRALGRGAELVASTFKSLTTGAGNFQDLSDSTGAAAEDIASFAVAAATAGVSVESIGTALNKLSKNLVGVNDDTKPVGAALKAIGIDVKAFKQLDPAAQYEAVGKALNGFAEGGGKAAVAQFLLGKAGAEQLRVFAALEDQGGRQVILTKAQIERADAYSDAQSKARAQLQLYAQAAASEAIPAITDLTAVAVQLAKEFLGVDDATGKLNANNGAKKFAEDAADAVAFLVDQVDLVVRLFQTAGKTIAGVSAGYAEVVKGNFAAAKAIGQALSEDLDQVWSRATFAERLLKQRTASAETAAQRSSEPPAPAKPKLNFNFDSEAAGKAEAELKKRLDGQLKAIRDFAQQQKDAFDFANQIVKGSYEDGRTSLQQFYASEAQIRDVALQSQLAAIDKEIGALQVFKRAANKPEDRIDAENKIAEAVTKRADTVAKASRENVLSALEEQRATASLARSYVDLIAQVRDLSGDKRGAASLRIARQVADAQKLISQQGGDPALAGDLERQLSGAADLSDEQERYNRLVERARNEEESLLLAAQAGGKSELETLRSVGAARSETLKQLAEMVDRANELALALGTPDAIRFAEQLGLALKRATAEVDPLLVKIRDIGREAGDSIAESFTDAISQGKGLRATLKAIGDDLSRIVARNLITKPLGDYLSNLIGGNGQASGGGGLFGSLFSAASGYFGGSGFSAYDASGYGITSGGASLGSLGLGGGRAIGGPTMPNTKYSIAERRPEVYSDGSGSWLITGSQRGRVDPDPSMGGGRSLNVTNNFTVAGNVDRRTQSQIAALAGRSVAAASARNN